MAVNEAHALIIDGIDRYRAKNAIFIDEVAAIH